MVIGKFLEKQRHLDDFIIQKSTDPISDRERLTDTILAMMVEVGEMANEVRCFKHWSKKPPSDKHVILEEFIDVFHFFLSIANQLGFTEEDIVKAYETKYDKNIERQHTGY